MIAKNIIDGKLDCPILGKIGVGTSIPITTCCGCKKNIFGHFIHDDNENSKIYCEY